MRFFLLLVILFTYLGCSNDNYLIENEKEFIDINLDHLHGKPVPNLEIKSIVELETGDSSIVGNASGIEIHDDNIYVLDKFESRAVFLFSENGAFIRKTKNGKGPGEMIKPTAIFLDKGSGLVYVWDEMSSSILEYNSELEFLSKKVLKNYLINFAILKNDRTIIHTHYYNDYSYKIIGPDNETVEEELIPDMKYRGTRSIFRSISINDRILVIAPFHYDIYELKDNDLHSVYYVNFGKYKLTKDDVESSPQGLRGLQTLITEGKKVSGLHDISEGESFLSFRAYFRSEELNFAYSFKQNKIFLINEYFSKNILPVCSVRGIAEDDVFYAMVEPVDLDNFQKETDKILIEGEINPESNPYIITFKLDELVDN